MKSKKIIALLTVILSLGGIFLINSGKTSLKTTGEVAGREEIINYTLPPGFIFSIWSVIYLGFLIYTIYGVANKKRNENWFNNTVVLVTVSICLNFLWTFIVGLEYWTMAFFLQGIMLVLAIVILQRFSAAIDGGKARQLLSVPFALYAGWLTVAMIPFAASLLNQANWDAEPFSRETWGIILYILAFLVIVVAGLRLRNPFYFLPLIWAYFGFAYRFDGSVQLTAIILGAGLFLLFAARSLRFYRTQNKKAT